MLVNNPEGWVQERVRALVDKLSQSYAAVYVERTEDVPEGDAAFFIGCSRIVPPAILARNRINLVVHGSDLPEGRGFSPIPWQVAAGNNRIPIVLFRAEEALDAGPIYLREVMDLDGTELLPEIHRKTWERIESLILRFLQSPEIQPTPQAGTPSFFARRGRSDDELDPQRSIADQFDRLRVVDNERYPAWFVHRGQRYLLRISKDEG
jgi:methionyl-tRNA formyltransferase